MPLQRRRREPRDHDHIRSKRLRSQARTFIRRVLSGCLPDDSYGDIEKSRPMLKISAPTNFVHHKVTIPGLDSYSSGVSLSTSDHAWTTATKLGDAKTTCIDSESSIDGSRPGTSSLADAVELSEKLDASLESMASSPTSSPFHQSSIEHYSPLTSSPPNHHQHLLQRHIFTVATPTPLPPRPATAAAVIGASVHRRRKSLGDMLSRRSKSVAEVVMPEALELAEARKEGGMLRRAKTTGVSKKE